MEDLKNLNRPKDLHVTWSDPRGKHKEREREKAKQGLCPWKDLKRKYFLTLGSLLVWSGKTKRELQRLKEEHNNWFAAGRTKRDLHRWTVPPPCMCQSETCVHWCGQGLGTEIRSSGFRGQAWEKTDVGCMEIAWRDWNVVRLQPGVFLEDVHVHQRSKPSLLNGAWEEGKGFVFSPFLHVPGNSPAGFRKAYRAATEMDSRDPGPASVNSHWSGFLCANHCMSELLSRLLSQRPWEQRSGGCQCTEVRLKPQLNLKDHTTLKAGLKSLITTAWAANLYLYHCLCKFSTCKTYKQTMGSLTTGAGLASAPMGFVDTYKQELGWATGPGSEMPPKLPQRVQVTYYWGHGACLQWIYTDDLVKIMPEGH